MNRPSTNLMATCLRDEAGCPSARPARSGQENGWIWAWSAQTGQRHLAMGGVCEDAAGVALRPGGLNLALADGVSGGARGDIAATALVRHCLTWNGKNTADLFTWIADGAETAVRQALDECTTSPGAATLAAAWLGEDGQGRLTRIGDCRAYTWQPAVENNSIAIQQMLPDQTLAYMGYAAPNSPKANQPAHMVGNRSIGVPEWVEIQIQPGTGLLLCSDGLHEVIDEAILGATLTSMFTNGIFTADNARCEQICRELVVHAQQLGSEDDISILLAARTSRSSDAPQELQNVRETT